MRGSRTCGVSKGKELENGLTGTKESDQQGECTALTAKRREEERKDQQKIGNACWGPGEAILESYSAWLATLVGEQGSRSGRSLDRNRRVSAGVEKSDTGGFARDERS
ncbi:hypothetical protein FHL15_001437 [Xylaria flabelliformis]|uniref:Uncharacterized protein n=1 Tax=Xylaria flabelliformis TaxID=2512241 RepID=A0A553IBX1_9PEZI|nr:hypothetical protein FHL15_001437 [Xylaria flabelliformis]